MKKAFEDLIEFERACGHELCQDWGGIVPDDRTKALRVRLINEEHAELIDAIEEDELPKIADGIADLIYVALGTAVRYGISLPEVWDAVHKANMAKFGPGSRRDETGKLCKPPGWQHPDIQGVLQGTPPLSWIYRGQATA